MAVQPCMEWITIKKITIWKETCIKFKKYPEFSFSATIYKIYWGCCSVKVVSFWRKRCIVETISVAIKDKSNMICFDLYLINIFLKSTKAERCTDVMFRLTLYCLSGTYIGWTRWNGDTTSKNKLYIYIYIKHCKYTLFCCPWFYFRYMVGTQLEQ